MRIIESKRDRVLVEVQVRKIVFRTVADSVWSAMLTIVSLPKED